MVKSITFLAFNLLSITAFAQTLQQPIKKTIGDPVYYLDSVNIEKGDLIGFDPQQVSFMNVYKGSIATGILGEDGRDGIIYIETKSFTKRRFQNYFKSKSDEYKTLLSTINNDAEIQYILDNKVLTKNIEGDLVAIDNRRFVGIKIISKETLAKDFGVTDKQFGVLILSSTPAGRHDGPQKF